MYILHARKKEVAQHQEQQQTLIFSKYEPQVEDKDSPMPEIKCFLDADKSALRSCQKYLSQIKELKQGIGKYEELLERHIEISREKDPYP